MFKDSDSDSSPFVRTRTRTQDSNSEDSDSDSDSDLVDSTTSLPCLLYHTLYVLMGAKSVSWLIITHIELLS